MSNNADRRIVDTGLGLTKREYFAALALQGMIAARYSDGHSELSRHAVQCADDLLAELAKEPT